MRCYDGRAPKVETENPTRMQLLQTSTNHELHSVYSLSTQSFNTVLLHMLLHTLSQKHEPLHGRILIFGRILAVRCRMVF